MAFSIHAFTIIVPDYDDGIEFYVKTLGFDLTSDVNLGAGKRWVLVTPDGGDTSILLAQPNDPQQSAAIGQQTGGRVGFFLKTDDFDRDYAAMVAKSVKFEERPRDEVYGTVAVFQDPFGNRWDLLQFK